MKLKTANWEKLKFWEGIWTGRQQQLTDGNDYGPFRLGKVRSKIGRVNWSYEVTKFRCQRHKLQEELYNGLGKLTIKRYKCYPLIDYITRIFGRSFISTIFRVFGGIHLDSLKSRAYLPTIAGKGTVQKKVFTNLFC